MGPDVGAMLTRVAPCNVARHVYDLMLQPAVQPFGDDLMKIECGLA